MEKRSLTGVVSFDLRRAFNTVDLAYYLNLNVKELKARKQPCRFESYVFIRKLFVSFDVMKFEAKD